MTIYLSAPSKTFLCGEYAVLAGGPGLIVNTQPRFELVAKQSEDTTDTGAVLGIPEGSPAYKWLSQRAPLLNGWEIEFKDPHEGKGGLGASSAQFLLVHSFTSLMQLGWDKQEKLSSRDLWNDFHVLSGRLGSGADLLAQKAGQVALTEVSRQEASGEEWPYADLGFAIFRTGNKVPTHEHLTTILPAHVDHLVVPAREVVEAFDVEPSAVFVKRVRRFSHALIELKLQAPQTLEILSLMQNESWCVAAKGCGAYGADTVMAFYPSSERTEVLRYGEENGLPLVATELDLSRGLEVQFDAR
jgi:mevalonate kinase